MARIGLTVLLALSLTVPAFAAADSALPVGGFAVASNGTLSGTGTLGGVTGTMTSTAKLHLDIVGHRGLAEHGDRVFHARRVGLHRIALGRQ